MSWIPRSGFDESSGLVWLPRMLQKARRFEEGRGAGRDLMDGYLYGDNDFIDAQLLAFLRTDDAAVSALVREYPSDESVAAIVIERSGRSADECRAFSKQMLRKNFGFAVLEADEGRMAPGIKRNLLRFFYNRILMPVVYAVFRRAERKKSRPAA